MTDILYTNGNWLSITFSTSSRRLSFHQSIEHISNNMISACCLFALAHKISRCDRLQRTHKIKTVASTIVVCFSSRLVAHDECATLSLIDLFIKWIIVIFITDNFQSDIWRFLRGTDAHFNQLNNSLSAALRHALFGNSKIQIQKPANDERLLNRRVETDSLH